MNSQNNRNRPIKVVGDSQSLGGTVQGGPVSQTVRNVWASKNPIASNAAVPTGHPADHVRSVWASRFSNDTNNLN